MLEAKRLLLRPFADNDMEIDRGECINSRAMLPKRVGR